MEDMTFEIDHTAEDITRELATAYTPQPRDPTRRQIVVVPPIPGALEMPELRAAAAELDRVRGELAAATAAVAAAESKRNAARQADAAAAAAAFRSGQAVAGPSALDALYRETAALGARQAAGRTAVLQLEAEMAAVLDAHRAEYITRTETAIGDALAEAVAALESYVAARGELLATMTVRNWLAGERKFATGNLPELRGISSSDRPAPRFEDVLASLRRELDRP